MAWDDGKGRLEQRDAHQSREHAAVPPLHLVALRRSSEEALNALQQLRLPLRLPAGGSRRDVVAAAQEPPAPLPDACVVGVLRVVELEVPAAHALDDDGRL